MDIDIHKILHSYGPLIHDSQIQIVLTHERGHYGLVEIECHLGHS
jgi:hypothetical protein